MLLLKNHKAPRPRFELGSWAFSEPLSLVREVFHPQRRGSRQAHMITTTPPGLFKLNENALNNFFVL